MKLSNGEVKIIDDLINEQQKISLYVEACSLPYHIVGSNKFDVQDIKTQKPVSYVNEEWCRNNFFCNGVGEYLSEFCPPKIENAYINMGIHSENPDVHVDSSLPGDKTLLYYINREWKHEWGGETIFLDDNAREIEYVTPFIPGRVILFDSTIPHAARQQSFAGPDYRFTLAIKFKC
jgi:hypothetical protein|tara:strand:- start:3116 stop:3646 length:531 start_codon:yes stop_codon:yes gene_type:complete